MMAVEQVMQELGTTVRPVCAALEVPYSSLMRWRRHRAQAKPAVGKPGPTKVAPLPLATLNADIRSLAHGRERTHGTGALYDRHSAAISRRDLQTLVATVRAEMHAEVATRDRHLDWRAPGMVWSMDDAQLERLPEGHGHVHVVHDLGSRYTLKSLGSRELAAGPMVARNLEELFAVYGAPLFLKRDNGGNLNHADITALLESQWVIPLNSPPYYPPYNGAVERKQQELQGHLNGRLGPQRVAPRVFELELEVSGHELNHKNRRSLGGRTACRALDDGRRAVRRYGRRQRKEVFEQIKTLSVDIIERLEDHSSTAAETAFRYAAETWMQQNHIINVTQNGKVLPCFYRFQTH